MTTHSPTRHIVLPGTTNFRDLGGYVGHAGRSVRWRVLFRSDHLAGLTPESLGTLKALGIQRSADFRGVQERTVDAYAWQGLHTHALTVEPTVVQKAIALIHAGGSLSVADTVVLMQETYRSFVRENAAQFAQLFRLLLEEDAPTVFHCTAGKDRTGWAAALLLTALGVDEEQIMEDYLLTNQLFKRPVSIFGNMSEEVLDALWRVQPSYLMASVDIVRAQHGSVDKYLTEALGVDQPARERLAQLYLAD